MMNYNNKLNSKKNNNKDKNKMKTISFSKLTNHGLVNLAMVPH